MRQVITTKYMGPTNYRGSRIKATCLAKSYTMPYQYDLNVDDNHKLAAETIHKSLGWDKYTKLIGGFSKDHCGQFVQVEL